MVKSNFIFTSESVTEGHPDKIADGIADCILDAHLSKDPESRVACEVLVTSGVIVIAGEITSTHQVQYTEVARQKLQKIGYTDPSFGFSYDLCGILVSIHKQSPDIDRGVTPGKGLFKKQGAGDQGMMFGFACSETPELMPLPIMLAHKLARRLAVVRKTKKIPFIGPDGKTQVSVAYENGKPVYIDTVVVSTQHREGIKYRTIKEAVIEEVIKKIIPSRMFSNKTRILVNPTGRFVKGGPAADTGVTGRKIIVDTYGGMGRHGGGALSGKDPTKVDRSGCYMARYVAKNIVAAKLARKCEVQIAYAIGYPIPVSLNIETFGSSIVPEEKLLGAVKRVFDFSPASIIENLSLKRPIYEYTSCYGHFGYNDQLDIFTWEKTDRIEALLDSL